MSKLRNRAQPLVTSIFPGLPWQKIATDLFEWKKENYLLIIDYYSRFIQVTRLKQTTAEEVIQHTKSILARHEIPEVVISDNGPQHSADAYKQFAKEYHFQHTTSSPYYPQSNGEVEQTVETNIYSTKRKTHTLVILSYKSNPLQNDYKFTRVLPTSRPSLGLIEKLLSGSSMPQPQLLGRSKI